MKTALVTGGMRGIGMGISKCLALSGYNLVTCGIKSQIEVQEMIDELETIGVQVFYIQADISSSNDRKRLVDLAFSRFKSVDTLVNNAGVAPYERIDLLDTTEESYDRVMDVNLKGPYFLTQLVAKKMVEQKKQSSSNQYSINNITSISATVASTSRGEFCVSKAGLSMMSKLWAVRLAEYEIPVYEIRPGIIATDMTSGDTEKYDKLINDDLLLQKRWGMPDDIGKAVVMLVNRHLPYSTGQVILIDGGFSVERL